MKAHLLFPRYFRLIGFLLAIPGLVLGYLFLVRSYSIPGFGPTPNPNDLLGRFYTYTNELALALVIIGLVFIAFSKVKKEDELTAYIRLNALYWAILVNYLILISVLIAQSFLGEFSYEHINLIMPLIIFILRFYYLLNRNQNEYYAPPLYFLPHKPFNKLGKILSLICLIIVIACTVYNMIAGWHETSVWDYFSYSFYVFPFLLLMWAYSRVSKEDEYIDTIRLNAMQIAIYVNYAILFFANLFLYFTDFLLVEVLNLSTIPLIFIIVFQYRLYQLSRQIDDKKSNQVNLNML